MKLSIIIPAKDEEENVITIYENIHTIMQQLDYEIIFIDDGSVDKTCENIESIQKKDKRHVKLISFSRNFGKDAAIYAGLEHASSEYTAIIDADMEQDPKYLIKMLEFLEKNRDFDQVAMTVKKRKAGIFKRIGGKMFYRIINFLSDTEFPLDASDFRMFRSNVKEAILSMPEKNRFSKGIFSWIGFKTKLMEYDSRKRTNGKSKFNFHVSLKYAMEGIVNFSIKPLNLAMGLGLLTSIGGFLYLIYLIIKTIIFGVDLPGFATIVCLILFIGGIQLVCLGILGKYLAKTFIETKSRPIYISKKKVGFEEEIL